MTDDEQVVEGFVLRKSLHPLEADSGLGDGGGADGDQRAGRAEEVVNAIFVASVVFALPRGRIATISRAGLKYAPAMRFS